MFEHTFTTPATAHAPMEPMVSVAEVGDGGSIVVHSATQNPSEVRTELAHLFGLPENKVRIRTAFLGGGFGGKLYPRLEPIAAACALVSGRPVRIALTTEGGVTKEDLARLHQGMSVVATIDTADVTEHPEKIPADWDGRTASATRQPARTVRR